MGNTSRTPARLMAFVALAACTLAVVSVLAGSLGGDRGDREPDGAEPTAPRRDERSQAPRRRMTYTVKPGDTLGAIAERTGTDVDALQELNPEVDSVSIAPGQRLKLR